MQKKRKVCFLIPTLNSGGIETYLLRFLNYINDNDLDVTVIVRNEKKGELYEEYKNINANVILKPLGYFNIKFIYWYYIFFKRKKFDVVVDFNANFAGLTMYLAKLAHITKRITFYRQGKDHFNSNFLKKYYNKWVKKLVFNNSTLILSNSKASLDYFFPKCNEDKRFKIIYNGMNSSIFNFKEKNNKIREELEIPLDAFVICHSGRLDPAKNHSTIINVAKEVIKQNNNVYFILCGLNTEKLLDKTKLLNIESRVKLLGYRKDVPDILNSSNLFYFPSLTEGQPNALIEALLSGLPFIASNIAPIKEIIPIHLHKYLIDPMDKEKQVNGILELLNEVSIVSSEDTKEWAQNFFSQDLRFLEFYNCLIY